MPPRSLSQFIDFAQDEEFSWDSANNRPRDIPDNNASDYYFDGLADDLEKSEAQRLPDIEENNAMTVS